ncbi:hypothetical protein [Halorussus salinisoli]|uniref:hypothetical protein n=1 Tax=Halorussus salinisoli TaxID=2558242 RepID=UPI0010C21BFA|nr:hypothetical protein [Halorussus salinisoli]
MDDKRTKSTGVSTLVVALLFAAVGGLAFWAWRKRAPLARSYRRSKRDTSEDRDARGPNPERNPGTDPV